MKPRKVFVSATKALALLLLLIPILWSLLPGYVAVIDTNWSSVWLTWDDILGGESIVINWRWGYQGPAYVICWNQTHSIQINVHADFLNSVKIDGLRPGETYYYAIGYYENGNMINWRIHSFRTPPASNPVVAIVLSDTHAPDRCTYRKILKCVRGINADVLIHCGDIVDRSHISCWAAFFKDSSSILSRIPIMPTIGNHDIGYGDPTLFYKFFELPNNGKWYYYRLGNAIFVSLYVAEMFTFTFPTEEYEMLKEAAEIARENNLWLIVYFHIPPIDVMPFIHFPEISSKLGEVFSTIKPDLILAGHYHVYGRTKFKGSRIVLMGASGGLTNQIVWSSVFEKYSFKPGFGLLRIEVNRLHFEYISADGEVLDSFELVRT
ncbi:MAG: metallophosphoesterase [Candidatus Korarchaeota archaeon]|nr:metallophosphoesterase family protein [Thermoproteota archaeon]